MNTGEQETINISQTLKEELPSTDKLCGSLLVKDKFSVPHEAYHELSTVSDLPNLYQVKKKAKSLNANFKISDCPNNVSGVQQSLKKRVLQWLEVLIRKNTEQGIDTPNTIKIKLTGDGTQIGRELKVTNIAFTIIEEGEKAQFVAGNYSLAILQTSESYDDLAKDLQDILTEAKDLELLTVGGKVYKIQFSWVEI